MITFPESMVEGAVFDWLEPLDCYTGLHGPVIAAGDPLTNDTERPRFAERIRQLCYRTCRGSEGTIWSTADADGLRARDGRRDV